MVQLVTLPGLTLDCPDINMPILKGFLEEHQIEAHLSDLNIQAFYSKMEKQSLISLFGNSPDAAAKADRVLYAISIMNGMHESTYEMYQAAGEIIRNTMVECAEPYGLVWNNKGIHCNATLNLETLIDECLSNSDFSFFDDVFNGFVSNITDIDQYIVLSVTSQTQYPFAIRLAKMIKDNGNQKIIITGSFLPYISELLPSIGEKAWWIDYHIIGHIEDIILELLLKKNCKKAMVIETGVWKKPEEISSNHLSCTPDFSDLDLPLYLAKELVLPLQVTNSCYYGKCRFCSFHYGDGNYYCSPDGVIEQTIDRYVNKYHVKHIIFVDRCIPAELVIQMCHYIIDKSYTFTWLLETRIDSLYSLDDNIALLKKAGCAVISFGIESAEQELLDSMQKGVDFSLAEKCMRKISRQGICVAATIMLLFFGETERSLQRTLAYLLNNDYLDLFGILFFSVTKHSPVYYENINILESTINKSNAMNQVFDRNLLSDCISTRQIDMLNEFFSKRIIKQHMECVTKNFCRSHYLFWPKDKFGFQSRKQ